MVILNSDGMNKLAIVLDGRARNSKINGEFDLSTLRNPMMLSLYDLDRLISHKNLNSNTPQNLNNLKELLARFSLNIHGFPPCPDEDLMLAVYFFFEEHLNLKVTLVKCTKYKTNREQQEVEEVIGVVLDKIQIVDKILRRAEVALRGSPIEVKRNKNLWWVEFVK